MKNILFAVALLPLLAFADDAKPKAKKSMAERRAENEYKMGGFYQRPKTGLGKAVVFNTQSVVAASNVLFAANKLESRSKMRFEFQQGDAASLDYNWPALRDKVSAAAIVVVLADGKTPDLLVAPDERWAVINVNRLDMGLKTDSAKAKFIPGRLRRQVIRAFALMSGSGHKGNLSPSTVNNLNELDNARESLPMEEYRSLTEYLEFYGMTQKEFVPYAAACQEGWAPSPTNDIQKAIWDEVHAIPEKPMKIKYDPNKAKPQVK